jgi:importin subunit beta-1
VFADIALAIGAQFERYAGVVLGILEQASTVMAANQDDEGEIEYINTLRVSILEAYTGIVHVSHLLDSLTGHGS